MCTPDALIVLGTTLGAGSSILGGQAKQDNYNAQAQQELQQAGYKMDQAIVSAREIRKQGRQAQGTARADLAASHVDVNSVTSQMIQNAIESNTQHDALQAILSGQRAIKSAKAQAIQDWNAGNAANQAGILDAGATVLSGWKQLAK